MFSGAQQVQNIQTNQQPQQQNQLLQPTFPINEQIQQLPKSEEQKIQVIQTIQQSFNHYSNFKSKINQMVYHHYRCDYPFTKSITASKSLDLLTYESNAQIQRYSAYFGINKNSILYCQDYFNALSDKIIQHKKNVKCFVKSIHQRMEFKCNSFIALNDFKSTSSISYYVLAEKQRLNSNFFHSIPNYHTQTLNRFKKNQPAMIRKSSQNIATTENLIQKQFSETEKKVQEDLVMAKIFQNIGLDEKLILLNSLRDQKLNSYNDSLIEEIFDCLLRIPGFFHKEFQILRHQFRSYPLYSEYSYEEKQKQILNNTVDYLETTFLQKIEAFDILTLNKTFSRIYSPYKFGEQILPYKNIYPSGILFLLMRAGKSNIISKIFEGWRSEDESIMSQILIFSKYLELEFIDEDTVKYIYNEKLQEPNVDIFLRQAYLILLKINEIEDMFETIEFPQDEELHIWLTLKTTYISISELPDYLQSGNTLYTHMSLQNLQNEAPEISGYIEDIYLQRYDNVIEKITKRYEINHELPLLMIILKECEAITIFEDIELSMRCVTQLGGLVYQQNPVLGTILLKLADCNDGMFVDYTGSLLVRTNVITKLLNDRKLRYQFEELALKKNQELINQIYDKMIFDYFSFELHKEFKSFVSKLQENSVLGYKYDLQCYENFMIKIDDMCQYLKFIQHQESSQQFILQEIHFLVLYCESLINIKIQLKDNTCFSAREILLEWRKLKKTDLAILNYLTKSCLQQSQSYSTQIFQLADIFYQLLQGLKKENIDFERLWNGIVNLMNQELLSYLKEQGKVELILMLLWTFKQILENSRTETKFMTQLVKNLRGQLSKQGENRSGYFFEMRLAEVMYQELDGNKFVLDLVQIYKEKLFLVNY